MLSRTPRRRQRRSSRHIVVIALVLAFGAGASGSIAQAQPGDSPRSSHGHVKKHKKHHHKQFSHEGRAPGAGHTASVSARLTYTSGGTTPPRATASHGAHELEMSAP